MTANLLDFDLEGLAAFCQQLGEKRFRAVQLFRWIHRKGEADFNRMSDLAASLRDKLAAVAQVAHTLAPAGTGLLIAPSHRMMTDVPMANVEAMLAGFRRLTL